MRRYLKYLVVGSVIYLANLNFANAQRYMEKLSRGVVAMRTASDQVFVSWRMFGTDPDDILFNLYRDSILILSTDKTNFIDTTTINGTYMVKPVINDVEGEVEGSYEMPENTSVQQHISIPLQQIGDFYVHYAWVGDLDGDGEYDYIISRHSNEELTPKIEAYLRDGTFLWRVDMGENSIKKANTNDNPSAAIGPTGNTAGFRDNDNITVYDLDLDGKAEVFVRTADGVIFGDSTVMEGDSADLQYISVIDGMTGEEKTSIVLPNKYIKDGPLGGHMGVGYLDGIHPSLIYKTQNRKSNQKFNNIIYAFDYKNNTLSVRWIFDKNTVETQAVEFHQIRIIDVDEDGKDEICDGGYVVDDDGTLLYTLGSVRIGHGDRFHITDFDPDRPGLEGYGIQQDNPTSLAWYYYNAKNGNIIQTGYTPKPEDLGRGTAADLNPNYRGLEYWTYVDGIINSNTGKRTTDSFPVPNFKIWWDGDLLAELMNRTFIEKWNYESNSEERLLTGYKTGATYSWRNAPLLHGDILGDWREEVIFEHNEHTEIQIFTTIIPTEYRLYTLVHNPGYRNSLNCRGYLQSNLTDYYLGYEMQSPPKPYIRYIGDSAFCRPIEVTPYIQINNGSWYQINSTTVDTGATIKLLAHFIGQGQITWNGPNGFFDTLPYIELKDVSIHEQGVYHFEIIDSCNVAYADSFVVSIANDSMNSYYIIQEQDTGFCKMKGSIMKVFSEYTGNGYLVPSPGIDNYISWTINVPNSGTYDLIWRYANDTNYILPARLVVNDVEILEGITFSPGDEWDIWNYISVKTELSEGDNNIVLEPLRSLGLPNIDYIKIAGYPVKPVYCLLSPIDIVNIKSKKSEDIYLQVFPNPVAGDEIFIRSNIKDDGIINLTLYNLAGIKILSKSLDETQEDNSYFRVNIGDLKPGIYLLTIERNGVFINDMLIVE